MGRHHSAQIRQYSAAPLAMYREGKTAPGLYLNSPGR